MSDQPTILSRIGNLFRRNADDHNLIDPGQTNAIETRSTFLRPWAGQRAGIQRLQDSVDTFTDLMGTIRENLESSSKRQSELLQHLSQLPEALRLQTENSRIHGETLKAIHQQLESHSDQQEKLGEILEKLSAGDGEQREAMGELRDHMESIRQTDAAISQNLSSLGDALENVSQNSTTGAQVLEQMRNRADARDQQLETILHKQSARFTTMLAIAIFLSTAAVVAVCVMGYLLIIKK